MLSYTRGPEMPLLDLTLSQALAETVEKYPDCEALVSVHQGARRTFQELARDVEQSARGLVAMGLEPGDPVAIRSGNSLEWIILLLACARACLRVVVLPADLAYEGRGRRVLRPEQLTSSSGAVPTAHARPEDVAAVYFTCDPTQPAKPVLLTHYGLVNTAWLGSAGLGIHERDRIVMASPLEHCFASVFGLVLSIVSGSALILPADRFDADATSQAIQSERPTVLCGSPEMFDPVALEGCGLRAAIVAGAQRSDGLRGISRVLNLYGPTEACACVVCDGRAMANEEIKIISRATGDTVPIGETGELCARSLLLMRGYDGDPEQTQRAIDSDGWLHTGDLAVMDSGETIQILGRAAAYAASRSSTSK